MTEDLAPWGLPKSPSVRDALPTVPTKTGWPQTLQLVDARLVPSIDRTRRHLQPSRRLSVLVADALELAPGLTVLLPRLGFEYLHRVVEATGARVVDSASDQPVDRLLRVEPAPPDPVPVADAGFVLRLDVRPNSLAFERILGAGGHQTRLGLLGLRLAESPVGSGPRTVKHLLELEGLEVRALLRRPEVPHDKHFGNAVESTWNPAAAKEQLSGPERDRLEDARDFFHLGYIEQFAGDLTEAIECYRASLLLFPTAEAHTFLGWAYHFGGRPELAIEECRRAIAVDPGFGNPYNDIGAYLLELKKPREALEWLQQATNAPRYATPHYAHCNAGRALMMMGHPSEARTEFLLALEHAPDYAPAMEGLRKLSPSDEGRK